MSIFRNPSDGGKRATSRVAALSGALLAVAALPLSSAAPAMADTHFGGCTINEPPKPEIIDGGSRLTYTVRLFCAAGTTVTVHQRFFEDDGHPDNFVGEKEHAPRRYYSTGWQTFPAFTATPNTEPGPEEVFQGVSFKVQGKDGRSAWDWGDAVTISQP